jgi:hypothetical protein
MPSVAVSMGVGSTVEVTIAVDVGLLASVGIADSSVTSPATVTVIDGCSPAGVPDDTTTSGVSVGNSTGAVISGVVSGSVSGLSVAVGGGDCVAVNVSLSSTSGVISTPVGVVVGGTDVEVAVSVGSGVADDTGISGDSEGVKVMVSVGTTSAVGDGGSGVSTLSSWASIGTALPKASKIVATRQSKPPIRMICLNNPRIQRLHDT